jgi:nucleoside-diphosphate kinase
VERTLIILKPDTVQRGLIGEIVGRIERRGMRIAAMKMIRFTPEMAERHYGEHIGKPFYAGLHNFIISGPLVVMVVEGPEAIAVMRGMMGKTNATEAVPGTIRGDLGISNQRNLIHGSDSVESAQREIALYFQPEEILAYEKDIEPWIHSGYRL